MDEGVQNLGQFCSVLAGTVTRLQDDTSTLEQHGTDVERLGEGLEESLTALGEALQDFQEGVEEAESSASGELNALAETARGQSADRLPGLEQEVDGAESGFEERIEGHTHDLDGGFSDLTQDGFDALGTAVDEVLQSAEASGAEGEQAFGDFESDLGGLTQDVETAGTEGAQALNDAAGALSGEEAQGLEADAEACASGWSDELPAAGATHATAIADLVVALYDGFGADTIADGDELIEAVSTAAQGAADLLQGEVSTDIEDASNLVVEESMGPYVGEQDEARMVLGVGADMAAELPPLVADLEIAKSVVAEVDRLLAALAEG